MEDLFELLQTYQSVAVLYPSYNGKMPPLPVIKQVISKLKKYFDAEPSPLLPVLQHGLGGYAYTLSPVYTKLGHFIGNLFFITVLSVKAYL